MTDFPDVVMEHSELDQINAIRELCEDRESLPLAEIDKFIWKYESNS